MSDMYLVLRRRLTDTVGKQEWVEIPTEVLFRARKIERGLSYEAMGRMLSVAAKTYERWEKDGRVPPQDIDRVAAILGLTIERPAFSPTIELPTQPPRLETRLERLEHDQQTILGHLEALREAADELVQGQAELLQRTAAAPGVARRRASATAPKRKAR